MHSVRLFSGQGTSTSPLDNVLVHHSGMDAMRVERRKRGHKRQVSEAIQYLVYYRHTLLSQVQVI